ncbi:Alpha-L-arabinofuranosidase [Thalassovita gelatinovora]|uniref:Alpha-L-arabinofuranosidase n=1 Tax=Thalassovita gelatinovora TaxID=53501 RepID=A0A0P1F6K8_THAGE|nr:hypothetical protein [Thalassovita gelatinovora]QIZ79143.1 type I secretion protein [Thalassovita gelatinovora]CUH63582.1 Alpha-L-arabinofuranosidase [Thalassovita gelatinovora]SER00071.1 hypothetical protein SAMN04488043_1137 [Thalassovita gelatinovora]
MIYLNAQTISGQQYNQEIFGANILASRDQLGEDGTYDNAAAALGVQHVRYPGGSLTEDYFDLSNPDNTSAIDPDTGREVELLPYTEFMTYAEENDIDVTIVLPTRHFLTEETDANGHRFANVDEASLRGFIQDTLNGEHGSPTIRAFEIGNEYWGSGEMDSLEYGRVSSQMAQILNEEIDNHSEGDTAYSEVDILVQNGQNYGSARLIGDYDHLDTAEEQLEAIMEDYNVELDESFVFNSGEISWARVANEIILSEFDTAEERDAVDGVIAHIYSRGDGSPNSREYDLNVIDSTWGEQIDGLDTYVTEWNLRANRTNWDPEEQYGLRQAHEILNMTEVFVEHDVEAAHIWAVQQNNLTNLAGNEGDDGRLTVPGEMFRMMNESLVDTRPVSFEGSGNREHELAEEDTSVHGFYAEDRMVLFIASNTEDTQQSVIDLSQIMSGAGEMHIDVLGVKDGYNPTSPESLAEVTTLDPDQVFDNGILTTQMDGYEIIRVEIDNPDYTADFMSALNGAPKAEDEVVDDLIETPVIPEVPAAAEDEADAADAGDDSEDDGMTDAGDSDGGGSGGMGLALAILPFLALLGGL